MYTPLTQRRRRIARLHDFLSTLVAMLIASALAAIIGLAITGILHVATH